MNVLRLLLLISSLFAAGAVQAGGFSAKVIVVLDGDTLLVSRGDKPVKLRLAEIDAPEVSHAGALNDQPYGAASQKSLADMVMGKQVQVETRAVDDYGRIVASVSIAGLNVNHEQVRRGLAWEYSRFHSNKELVALQREAQQARRGMWAGEGNVEPSQWRKQHPSVAPLAAHASAAKPVPKPATSDPACNRRYCSEMPSCAEAKRYFARCGGKLLDGDGDGRPCEKLCATGSVQPR